MGYKEIDQLLEKYFDGRTSLEEEQFLRDFLSHEKDVKPEWQHARLMLEHFKEEQQVIFESPLLSPRVHKKPYSFWKLSGIAATLLILLTAGWFYVQPVNPPVTYAYINGQIVTEKAVALEEMKKALTLMSHNLNQGTKSLEKLSKLEEVRQSVAKKKQ